MNGRGKPADWASSSCSTYILASGYPTEYRSWVEVHGIEPSRSLRHRTGLTGTASDEGPTHRLGALVPLSRPGWIEAGRHLLGGLNTAIDDVNRAGGVLGRSLELVVRDTAADAQTAVTALEELADQQTSIVVGEYHSVVARAAATTAHDRRIPFLCTSAVLDSLTEEPTDWVARIAPAQSYAWRIFADYLVGLGCKRVAIAVGPGLYWETGLRILSEYLTASGGVVHPIDIGRRKPPAVGADLVDLEVDALIMLVGYPEPAVSIVDVVRLDERLSELVICAPAGQPEFDDWLTLLGANGAGIPFLRYSQEPLGPIGASIRQRLMSRLGAPPSFVALEAYDTIIVAAEVLRSHGPDLTRHIADAWRHVSVEGTRGTVSFSRTPGVTVWQWAWPPVQVVDRDPAEPTRFRVLHAVTGVDETARVPRSPVADANSSDPEG